MGLFIGTTHHLDRMSSDVLSRATGVRFGYPRFSAIREIIASDARHLSRSKVFCLGILAKLCQLGPRDIHECACLALICVAEPNAEAPAGALMYARCYWRRASHFRRLPR